jgi:c-di-GMP-binding flagellar brake protein YcgR
VFYDRSIALPARENAAKTEDRRSAVRFGACDNTVCNVAGGNGLLAWQVRPHDISATGISLLVPRRIQPGTLLCVDLENSLKTACRTMLARVVRVSLGPHKYWVLGCAFVRELDDRDLKLFSALANCRAWVRISCDLPAVFAGEQGEPHEGRILNVSAGGMGLFTSSTLKLGTTLTIDVPAAKGDTPRQFAVRVVQSAPHRDGWLHGCEFINELSDEQIQDLLL